MTDFMVFTCPYLLQLSATCVFSPHLQYNFAFDKFFPEILKECFGNTIY